MDHPIHNVAHSIHTMRHPIPKIPQKSHPSRLKIRPHSRSKPLSLNDFHRIPRSVPVFQAPISENPRNTAIP